VLTALISHTVHGQTRSTIWSESCPLVNPNVTWHKYWSHKVPANASDVPMASIRFNRASDYNDHEAIGNLRTEACYGVRHSYIDHRQGLKAGWHTTASFRSSIPPDSSHNIGSDPNEYRINIMGVTLGYNDLGEVLDKKGRPVGEFVCHALSKAQEQCAGFKFTGKNSAEWFVERTLNSMLDSVEYYEYPSDNQALFDFYRKIIYRHIHGLISTENSTWNFIENLRSSLNGEDRSNVYVKPPEQKVDVFTKFYSAELARYFSALGRLQSIGPIVEIPRPDSNIVLGTYVDATLVFEHGELPVKFLLNNTNNIVNPDNGKVSPIWSASSITVYEEDGITDRLYRYLLEKANFTTNHYDDLRSGWSNLFLK